MAKYQPIYSKAWSDPWFAELKPSSKLLFLYLLTTPLNTPTGIYHCLATKMAFDTGLSRRQVVDGLVDLAGHVEYDEEVSLVWVVAAAKYWPKNPGVLKAMAAELRELGDHQFAQRFLDHHPTVAQRLPNGSGNSGNGLPTPEESDSDSDSDPESNQEDLNSDSDSDTRGREASTGSSPTPTPSGASPDGKPTPCGEGCPCGKHHISPGVRMIMAGALGYSEDGAGIRKLLHGEAGDAPEREALRNATDDHWREALMKINETGAMPRRNPKDGSIREGWLRKVVAGLVGA